MPAAHSPEEGALHGSKERAWGGVLGLAQGSPSGTAMPRTSRPRFDPLAFVINAGLLGCLGTRADMMVR